MSGLCCAAIPFWCMLADDRVTLHVTMVDGTRRELPRVNTEAAERTLWERYPKALRRDYRIEPLR